MIPKYTKTLGIPSKKCVILVALCLAATSIPLVSTAITSVSISPSNSGIHLGDMSVMQSIVLCLAFLKLVILTSSGVLPIDVDLGGMWAGGLYLFNGIFSRRSDPRSMDEIVGREMNALDSDNLDGFGSYITEGIDSYNTDGMEYNKPDGFVSDSTDEVEGVHSRITNRTSSRTYDKADGFMSDSPDGMEGGSEADGRTKNQSRSRTKDKLHHHSHYYLDEPQSFAYDGPQRGSSDGSEGGSTFLVDCPLQYMCEVDSWAHRDHQDNFLENLLAPWFRSDKPWIREEAGIYGGSSSCREMYPCPFEIQDVVGFSIPGSSNATTVDTDLIGPYSL